MEDEHHPDVDVGVALLAAAAQLQKFARDVLQLELDYGELSSSLSHTCSTIPQRCTAIRLQDVCVR